ncbi:probable L-type lectin-domain containing receptor kinase S.5 [Phragmites australis]|uniref:probable L-type lectin-domain containing receptor kinase S.5 n=1 Tax=Phragmites australis TaxID=29695 RepID=UPI002D786FAE|nr:probable L-type lectin-domain containing receptor kinase S.5 [Phragmites australis]
MAVRFLVRLLLATTAAATSLATNATAAGSRVPAAPGGGGDNVNTFSFSGFYSAFRGANVTVLGDANINQGALQITPDSLNDPSTFLTNKSGRVLYATPFKVWHRGDNGNKANDTGGKRVASFSTVFTVNFFRPKGMEPAEGFAFVIAPSADEPPAGSYGGYLGLTSAATDGNTTNQIVAVELDTEKQAYDPDDNHVGLNVNSVVSVANTSLKPLGIEISPIGTVKYNVWIDYDGAARRIAVYMAVAGKAKPVRAVLNAPLDLGKTVAEWSYFGFSASTGRKYQLNCVLAWNMTVEKLPCDDDNGKSLMLGLAIGVPVGLVALVAAAILAYVYVVKRRKVHGHDGSPITGTMIRSLAGGPREFDYRELRKATNNFDEKMKLGQGGYGVVYRGVVVRDHSSPGGAGNTVEVAVKKFSRASTQGQNDFLAELSIINRLRHKHLVRLVGWSHDNGELLLVYEFMPNGSLDQHLFSSAPGRQLLGWELRYNIIKGVASALHYLHDEYDQRVVHRDLKASNIMLDAAFSARLGDFGLARAIETDKTSYMEEVGGSVPGTMGYIAPECFHAEKATRESDVYAFGAVVLEVVCGRRPRCDIDGFHFLVDWVWRLHRDARALEAVDPRLEGAFDRDQAERLILLGLACSHPTPAERPKTPAIQQILLGSVPPPVVPPFKPSFVWPATDGGLDTMSTTAGTTTSHVSLSSASTWSGNFMRGSLSHAFEQDVSNSLP